MAVAVVGSSNDKKDGQEDGRGLAGASVRLEPRGSIQDDPFIEDPDVDSGSGAPAQIALSGAPELEEELAASLSGHVAVGTLAGLYGGSASTAVCDPARLIAYLTAPENAAQGRAWADVQGITVEEIDGFVRQLTPVRLRFDTRVTNHGFEAGEATPTQAILQAGTGVLIDETGVPRVKCNCGNPLTPPQALRNAADESAVLDLDDLARNPEDAWPALEEDPAQVVTVRPGERATGFALLDVEDGSFFGRQVGTNGEVDVPIDPAELCEDEELSESPSCDEARGRTTTTTEPDSVQLAVYAINDWIANHFIDEIQVEGSAVSLDPGQTTVISADDTEVRLAYCMKLDYEQDGTVVRTEMRNFEFRVLNTPQGWQAQEPTERDEPCTHTPAHGP